MLGAQEIRSLANSIGLKPDKRRGQNFVIDPNTITRIVKLAKIQPTDVVLEVGPGLGSLTLGLLETGASVIAVEVDERLAALLPQTAARHESRANLTVIAGDALQEFDTAQKPTHLVANLPYNLAVPILLELLRRLPSLAHAVVMVQLEVAQRLTAKPGSEHYGAPSAKLAWYGHANLAGQVSRNVFWPIPNVDSALVSFRRDASSRSLAMRDRCFEIIDAAFGQRRKTLRQSLSAVFGSPVAASEALRSAAIPESARGEELAIADFLRLAEVAR